LFRGVKKGVGGEKVLGAACNESVTGNLLLGYSLTKKLGTHWNLDLTYNINNSKY
jgi:hypothetical protein